MRQCSAWTQCPDPVKWIHKGGAIYCQEHRMLNRSPNWRRLNRAEQRVLNAGIEKVRYAKRLKTRDAVLILLRGR